MDSKLLLVTLFCVLFTLTFGESDIAIKLETGGKPDRVLRSIYNSMTSNRIDDTESSGDDEVSSGDKDGDDIYSGSGSGDITTTAPKGGKKDDSDDDEKTTPEIVVINTAKPSKPVTTDDTENEIPTKHPGTEDPDNTVEASTGDKPEKAGVKFTIGIIIGVVVGAVLAILVIVFLVYRLRKKDEGSYSLDEQSSQAFIRDEKNGQGKEYFA